MTAPLYSIQKEMQNSSSESFSHSVGEPSQSKVKEIIPNSQLAATLSPEGLLDNSQKLLLSESEETPLKGKSAKDCMKLGSRSACEDAESPSERCLRSKGLKKPLNRSPKTEAEKSHMRCSSRTHKKPHDEATLNSTPTNNVDVPIEDAKKLDVDLLTRPQRKRGPTTRSARKRQQTSSSDVLSSPATEYSGRSSSPILRLYTVSAVANTPKRRKRQTGMMEACLTSTPDRNPTTDNLFTTALSPVGAKQEDPGNISQSETPDVESPFKKAKAQHRHGSPNSVPKTMQPKSGKNRVEKELSHVYGTNDYPPAVSRRGRRRLLKGDLKLKITADSSQRCRPRFELQDMFSTEQVSSCILSSPERITQDETSQSSDLSIDLSHPQDQLSSNSEEEEEEEELPSFLSQEDEIPPPISDGVFVWCKLRKYPFWPALVKSVNRKLKKASIVFIDSPLMDIKSKGLIVALKTLKPFDCKEASQLVNEAKEKYDATTIEWTLELISDYRVRVACSSFTGSFVEYLAHDMSYPVRRTYPQQSSEILTIPSNLEVEEYVTDEHLSEQQGELVKCSKRLLPDRTHAAHNRANKNLVHFIVKKRKVEKHLLAVISGKQQSEWLCSFLSTARKQMVGTYLEDDEQLDLVYQYLNGLYCTAPATAPCLFNMKLNERVRFILDVLLPEAIIHAIAGVDDVSLKSAEEKYLKGRRLSNREKQEIDWTIEEQMRRRSLGQSTAQVTTLP